MLPRSWRHNSLVALALATACAGTPAVTPPGPVDGPVPGLRLDPMLLVSVAEVRRILDAIGDSIYPGLAAERIPVLLYRPGVKDVLVGFPKTPVGFRPVRAGLLGGETVLLRDDSTYIGVDDQNTTRVIDSVRVAVIADPYSRQRNRLRGALLERPREIGEGWLAGWNFIPSAYDELQVLLHEMFHVVQAKRAPGKSANEAVVSRYPVLDSLNNSLVALEALALRDALLAGSAAARRDKAAQFVALRVERRSRMDSLSAAWEDLNEFSEGTGRYVEYRFMKSARRLRPASEMFLRPGFRGYDGATLDAMLRANLDDMVAVAAGTDNRFDNPHGSGPARFRSYALGAGQALLLDEIGATWKDRIFSPGVYLFGLLTEVLALSPETRARALAAAKQAYRYDSMLVAKGEFERRGRALVRARLDSIRAAGRATVTIAFERAGARLGMAYTPFGVTAVGPQLAIYEQVPIGVRFENGAELTMKDLSAVIVDRNEKTVTFAATSEAADIVQRADGTIETDQFRLVSVPGLAVTRNGRSVRIELR